MKSNLSQNFTDRLEKSVKRKRGQSKRKFMSIQAKEEYNEKIKIAEMLLEVLLK